MVNVDQPSADWPKRLSGPYGVRGYFKWSAGADYRRDAVVPVYDWYQVTLAFYSFFRSDRQSVLYHPLRGHDWYPFQCATVERTAADTHDERDRQFLQFLATSYCVR